VRRSRVWPWGIAALVVALGVLVTVLSTLAGPHGTAWWENALFCLVVLASVVVGLKVAVRRPGNPIGWLLLANGLAVALLGVAEAYAEYAVLEDPGALPGGRWAVLASESLWPLLFAPLAAIVLIFPDGRLPSPRWRGIAVGAALSFAGLLLVQILAAEDFASPYEHVTSPLPEVPAIAWLWPVVFLGVVGTLVAAVWAVRVRFRRATGIERLQLKWLAYAAFLVPATVLVCLVEALITDGDTALTVSTILMLGAIPVSVGVAVLRYRLYDIDRLINRTLVYGVLTLLLAGVCAAIALGLGVAAGGRSGWITAAATLAAAAAFRPLRERVQSAVDRRFAPARYHALRRVEAFLSELRAGRAAPESVEGVLAQALGDPRLELRYWLPESELYVDGRGRPVADSPGDARDRTPVERAGAPLGVVLHDATLVEERPDLLASVVEAAGLAIEIARLRVELRRQLDEVEASRARIVAAGYEERRRIERDLHDGAQQRLVTVGLALRHLQHELAPTSNGAGGALDGVVEEIGRAIFDLRELARGVRPSQLDDGLAAALRELGDRASLPVKVLASDERFPEHIEAAAYFIACEGLTNAIKHANASKITVSAARANERLVISVVDDGGGGATATHGSGLAGLADRVEAQGGTLRLASSAATGTNLTVELPCAS
jgi:signal transduction histidine kinase